MAARLRGTASYSLVLVPVLREQGLLLAVDRVEVLTEYSVLVRDDVMLLEVVHQLVVDAVGDRGPLEVEQSQLWLLRLALYEHSSPLVSRQKPVEVIEESVRRLRLLEQFQREVQLIRHMTLVPLAVAEGVFHGEVDFLSILGYRALDLIRHSVKGWEGDLEDRAFAFDDAC